MTISIGMPVYNGETFLCEAIESILAQTWQDIEVIISDNASTDRTADIIRHYASRDKRITAVRQSITNNGLKNFETVLERSSGNLFMWAAHDDLWDKHYLSRAAAMLESSTAQYAFPSFELVSTRWRMRTRRNPQIFRFIEHASTRRRVMAYANLHHNSHKCNIVYSLFRLPFIREIWGIQDISNDGLMGTAITRSAPGILVGGYPFKKRYVGLWPGWDHNGVLSLYRHDKNFAGALSAAKQRAQAIFPEYEEAFAFINAHYLPFRSRAQYQIVDWEALVDRYCRVCDAAVA